jgi:hypothetical protein
LTLTASAGTSWVWSNGATTQSIAVTTSGNFSVTITNANGCQATSSTTIVTVNPAPVPVISATGPLTFCQGGQVTLFTGAAQSYLWSNGATTASILVNQSGNYSVTVTYANGCQVTSAVTTVTVNPSPVMIISGNTNVCEGGSTVLTVSGADSYIWSPAEILNTTVGNTVTVTPTALPGNPTTVTVTGITNGCSSVTEEYITISPSVPVGVIITSSDFSISVGESVTFTSTVTNGGTAPIYQWYLNGTAIPGATAPTYTTSSLANGDDVWVVVNSNSTAPCLTNNPAISNTIVIEVLDCQIGEIQGQQILCGYSLASFTVTIPQCVTSYSWDLPQGMTIIDQNLVAGVLTIDVSIDQLDFTSGDVIFNALYSGGSASDTFAVTQVPFTPQFLTTSACGLPNTTVTFEVIDVPGVDSYTWTQPNLSSLLYGQSTDSVRVKFGTLFNSGILSVVATNACGSSPAAEFFILAPPARPNQIFGSTTACTAVPSQLYYVDSVAHASYYIWGMPTGATIISNPATNDSVYVMFQNFTSGTISVKSANVCGSSTMRYLTISAPSIAAPTGISGPQSVCSYVGTGQIITYTTPSVSGVTNYIWSVPAGATIVSGSGTNSIGVQFATGFTGGILGVALSNGCSLSQQTTLQLAGVSTGGSPQSIVMNGLTSVCSLIGSGSTTYSVTPPVGANGYIWSVPAGVTIISGQGTASITVSFGTGFVSGQISVTVTTLCGTTYQQSKALTKVPSAAGAINGPTCITAGSSYTYSIGAVSGATSYLWSVPANATITSGQGTATVVIQYSSSFSGGTITVTPSNTCGSGSSSSVSIGLTPVMPTLINGPLTACAGNTLTYSVPPVAGATSYIWAVPVGMTIIGPTSGASIQVSVNSAFIAGVISCKSVTGCGSSTMVYTNTISNAGCTSQFILNEDINPASVEISEGSIDKAYISDVEAGRMIFSFENDILLEQITIQIGDGLGLLYLNEQYIAEDGFNSYILDLKNLDPGTYQFKVLDDGLNTLLKYEIVVNDE